MAVLAHPDDESLGFGGTLAAYAADGVDVSLVTATRGDRGRYRGHPPGAHDHPGAERLGAIREAELRDAAAALGIGDVSVLGHPDGGLDRVAPSEVTAQIAGHIRRVRPHVVVTFGPDGAYGHPDHIAISQFTTAACMAAADIVSKLYYLAWPAATFTAYESAIGSLRSLVDGVERRATPWPEWSITTTLDTRHMWPTVRRAVACHQSQVSAYERLASLPPEAHAAVWGHQSFYRAFSLVNGGRTRETDLFEGMRYRDAP